MRKIATNRLYNFYLKSTKKHMNSWLSSAIKSVYHTAYETELIRLDAVNYKRSLSAKGNSK